MIYFLTFFYEELSVVKTNKALRGYGTTYKVGLIDKKGLQLEATRWNIKDLFNDLLDETKSTEIEFYPVYFNSATIKSGKS